MLNASACPALLLNADFRPLALHPLKLVGWQDAVKDVMAGRVQVVAEYDRVVRSPGRGGGARGVEMRLPSVVALRDYQRLDRPVAFSRIGIAVRDRWRCQYCNERLAMRGLTFDHVVPQSKGGRTSWLNVVASCGECNHLKGDRPLERSGLRLLRKPWVPNHYQLNEIGLEFPPAADRVHPTWRDYLGMPPVPATDLTRPARVTEGASGGLPFPTDMTSEDYWNAELDE